MEEIREWIELRFESLQKGVVCTEVWKVNRNLREKSPEWVSA
jgi:hypothetical protein